MPSAHQDLPIWSESRLHILTQQIPLGHIKICSWLYTRKFVSLTDPKTPTSERNYSGENNSQGKRYKLG